MIERRSDRQAWFILGQIAALLALPTTVFGQMCTLRSPAPRVTEIAVQTHGLVDGATLGFRQYREVFWGGLFVGNAPREAGFLSIGSDEVGPYIGLLQSHFLGAGAEAGVTVDLGPFQLCLDGGLAIGTEQSATLDKFYTNSFGQTIGFEREDLDAGLSSRLWRAGLSMDHALADVGAAGFGLFVERSMLFGDDSSGAIQDYSYAGASLGGRLRPWEQVVVEVSYRHPLATFDDEIEDPDGWIQIRLAWIL